MDKDLLLPWRAVGLESLNHESRAHEGVSLHVSEEPLCDHRRGQIAAK